MLKIYFYRINETELDTKRERALSVLPFWRVEKYTRMIPRSGKLLSLAAGLLLRHAMLDTTGIELKELEIAFNKHEKPYLTGRRLQGEGRSAGLIDGQLTGRSDELTARQFTGRIEGQIEGKNEEHVEALSQFEPVFFNLSHAGEYVALAVSDTQVGIDVETKQDPGHGVAEHVFNDEERAAMKAAEDPERYFTRLWTRKEAYVKCTGTGISVPLNEFSVLGDVIIAREEVNSGEKEDENPAGRFSQKVEICERENDNGESANCLPKRIYQIRTLQETPEYALSVCVQSEIFPQFSLDIVEEFSI